MAVSVGHPVSEMRTGDSENVDMNRPNREQLPKVLPLQDGRLLSIERHTSQCVGL